MFKPLTKNARKPEGLWGSLMIYKMNLGHARMTRWAISCIDPHPGWKAVDIGCGGGKAVRRLLKSIRRGKVYGVDYSLLSVNRARRANRRFILQGRADIIRAGVSRLPFRDNRFDLATAFETIYFWPDQQEDLKEIYRVLKPGGQMAVICEMVERESADTEKYEDVVRLLDMNIPTPDGLAKLMKNAGFTRIRTWNHQKYGWICMIGQKPA